MDDLSLAGFLTWLTSAAGAAAATYWLMENVKWFKVLDPEPKRYVSLALSGSIPVVFWLLMVLMGYTGAPGTWRAWVEAIFAIAAPAVIGAQGLHGALKLRKRGAQ
ncbi:MAG: hypothetical protein WC977_08430 [Anaerovoracaceae bacterium]